MMRRACNLLCLFLLSGCTAASTTAPAAAKARPMGLRALAAAQPMMIGANIDGISEAESGAFFSDLAHYFNKWESVQPGGASPTPAQLSADGYPLVPAKSVCGLHGFPDGDYQLSFTGSGTVALDGALSFKIQTAKGADGAYHAVLTKHGDGVGLTVTPAAADTVHNLSILRPGAVAGQTWDKDAVALFQKFAVLRCMDLMRTNGSQLRDWKDRRKPADFPWSGPPGIPYEAIIDLATQTGRPIWVCLPALASDDFVHQFARLFHDRYPVGLPLYVEYSNELWNTAFTQFHDVYNGPAFTSTLPDLPAPEAGKTGGFTRTAVWIGARNYQCQQIFAQEWGADAGRVRFIYGGRGQAPDGVWWNEQGLAYVKSHYGDPSKYFYALAIAPYFGLNGSDDNPAGIPDLDHLFAALQANIDTRLVPWCAANKALADKYGLRFVGYESGQSLFSGTSTDAVKAAAQNDPRMGTMYHKAAAVWRSTGFETVNHLSLKGAAKWWPLLATGQATSVKYEALMAEQPALSPPVVIPPVTPPPAPAEGTATIVIGGRTYTVTVQPK